MRSYNTANSVCQIPSGSWRDGNRKTHTTVHHQLPPDIENTLPLFKLCDFAVWSRGEVGRGYSGVVYHGVGALLDEQHSSMKDSRTMAIKLSRSRCINFGKEGSGAGGREFETLRLLHSNRVPVPRPLGFCVNSDDQGNGRTVLLMELVEGLTLREWINAHTDHSLRHAPTGRTIHPAPTTAAAVDRLEVAVGLVEALQRLHYFGVFVDLKPRNIMVAQHKTWQPYFGEGLDTDANIARAGRFAHPITLVDIGGIVLRSDVEVSPWVPELPEEEAVPLSGLSDVILIPAPRLGLREMLVFPSRHRALLETTCSYISPELAALIVHNDAEKQSLSSHFSSCLCEHLQFSEADVQSKVDVTQVSIKDGSGAIGRAAEMFSRARRQTTTDLSHVRRMVRSELLQGAYERALQRLTNSGVLRQVRNQQSFDWCVEVGQGSSVFSLGLILVELFGGMRTGLTSLSSLAAVTAWFSKEYAYDAYLRHHRQNAWRRRKPLETERCTTADSTGWGQWQTTSGTEQDDGLLPDVTRVSCATGRRCDIEFRMMLDWDAKQLPIKTSPDILKHWEKSSIDAGPVFHRVCVMRREDVDTKDRGGLRNHELLSFHELYKIFCFPPAGMLSTTYAVTLDCGAGRELLIPFGDLVQELLDGCLSFSPDKRPSFGEVRRALHSLRLLLDALSRPGAGQAVAAVTATVPSSARCEWDSNWYALVWLPTTPPQLLWRTATRQTPADTPPTATASGTATPLTRHLTLVSPSQCAQMP